MQRDDFMKLKLKFAQTDVAGKIAIYTAVKLSSMMSGVPTNWTP